ncbi:MAG: hypothetical protein J7L20_01680, partial [Thermoplasmata archaeon]|nr:hypothetical protein [Thermoplasmata archaeon]
EKANEIAEDILKRLRIPRGIPRIEKIITTMEEMLREGQLWNGKVPHKTICDRYNFSETVLFKALKQATPEHKQKIDEIYEKKEEMKRTCVLEEDIDPIARRIAHKHGLHVASEDEFDELFTKAHKELTEMHANEKNLTYEEASKKAAEAIRRVLSIDKQFFSWTKIMGATQDELHRYCDMLGLQYSKDEKPDITRIKLFKHFKMENKLEEKAKKLVAAYETLKKPYREPTIDELLKAVKPTNISEFYLLRTYAKEELKKEIRVIMGFQAKPLDAVYELVKEKGGFQPSIREVMEKTGLKECAAHKCILTVMKAIGKKEEMPLITIRKAEIKEDPYKKMAKDQLYLFIPTDYKYFIIRLIDEGVRSRSLLEHEILKVGGTRYFINQHMGDTLDDLERKGIIRSSGRTYELTELGKKILDATNYHFYEGILPVELKTRGLESLSYVFGKGLARSSCRTFLELADLHESVPERRWISLGKKGELKQRTSTIMKNFARVGAVEFETAPPWEKRGRIEVYVYELSSDIKKIGKIPKRELEEIKNIPLTGRYDYETKKKIEELLKKYKVSPHTRNIIKSPVALLVAWSLARGATQYKDIAKKAGISKMLVRQHISTFLEKGLVVRRPPGVRIRFEDSYAVRILNYLRAIESIVAEHLKEKGVKPPKPKEKREKKPTPKKVEIPVFSIEKIPTMEEAIEDLRSRGYIDAEERAERSIELLKKLHEELGKENPDPSRVRQLVTEWGVWYGIPGSKRIAECVPEPFSVGFSAVHRRILKAGKKDPKLLEKWKENQYHNPSSIYGDIESLTKDKKLPEKVEALYEMCERAEKGEKINTTEWGKKIGLNAKTLKGVLEEGVDEYIAKRPRGKIALMVRLARKGIEPLKENIKKIMEEANKRPLAMRQAFIEMEIEKLVVKYAEEKGISMEEAYERIMKLFEEYT